MPKLTPAEISQIAAEVAGKLQTLMATEKADKYLAKKKPPMMEAAPEEGPEVPDDEMGALAEIEEPAPEEACPMCKGKGCEKCSGA